uniref:Uncharacterized protein n=1 Tax=Falco tinnunculus TaxID=100819 RepID=A0A8C4XS50_FALTI
ARLPHGRSPSLRDTLQEDSRHSRATLGGGFLSPAELGLMLWSARGKNHRNFPCLAPHPYKSTHGGGEPAPRPLGWLGHPTRVQEA